MPDIELKKIQPNRLNPRLEFSKVGLDELADSIKRVGLLEPIIVRPTNSDTYEIVVGERRYRAAQQAGLDSLPTIIADYTDEEVMEINFIENVQRENLTAVEKGRICNDLLKKFPQQYPNKAALARRLGVSESSVGDWLLTTRMPEEVQRKIAPQTERGSVPNGKVDYRTAVQISRRIKEPEKFTKVIEQIAEKRIPRRMASQVTNRVVREPDKPVEEIFREVVDEAPIFLPFSKAHADALVQGTKTQTSRKTKEPRLQPGVIVKAQVTYFADLEVTEVYRKKLGDFDGDDAMREGGYTLEKFKEVWRDLHGEWNPNKSVYVIQFKLVRQV